MCEICQGSGIEFVYAGHGNVLELPCECVCIYEHQPGGPYFDGSVAFEAYQNQQERDLMMYGNHFSIDGVRVLPDKVTMWVGETQKKLEHPRM